MLGGRDLLREIKGTWLGVTQDGRFAVLTNFREEGDVQGLVSRGAMVNAFLTQHPGDATETLRFVEGIVEDDRAKGSGGFSLVCGYLGHPLALISNRTADVKAVKWVATEKGETVGLSNTSFDDHTWPKVIKGEKLMDAAIAQSVTDKDDTDTLISKLFDVLSIDTMPKKGSNDDWNSYTRQLRNSIFIPALRGEGVEDTKPDKIAQADDDHQVRGGEASNNHKGAVGMSGPYGTQKQTIVLFSKDGLVTFKERSLYDENLQPCLGEERDRVFTYKVHRHG